MVGPIYSAGTVGGLTAWRIGSLGGTLLALMNIIVVVRHTRQEEEAGRLELIGSGVGRAVRVADRGPGPRAGGGPGDRRW